MSVSVYFSAFSNPDAGGNRALKLNLAFKSDFSFFPLGVVGCAKYHCALAKQSEVRALSEALVI